MSNSLSVSAVTATLRRLLATGVQDNPPNTSVTARPPDKARGNNVNTQLNIFLYHTTLSAGWRNMDMPWQVKPGETGAPPLALNLFYLLTAYGENDDDTLGHLALGRAMSVLHDHPMISGEDIRLTLPNNELPRYDLYHQREGIRITYQPLTLEEISKLWTTFQSQYRISAAYQVSVILIDSARVSRTPLPVLRQGEAGTGPVAQAGMTPPFPTLLEVRPPDPLYSAQPGDWLTLTGHHLAGDEVTAFFRHRALAEPNTLPPVGAVTATGFEVLLPTDAAASGWPAGGYDVWVVTGASGQPGRTTNELHLALAPRIDDITPNPVTPDANGDLDLTVTVTPPLRFQAGQTCALLIGDLEVRPRPPAPDPVSQLTFRFRLAAGDYFARLRVDGVDSVVVDRAADPPAFDDAVRVTVS